MAYVYDKTYKYKGRIETGFKVGKALERLVNLDSERFDWHVLEATEIDTTIKTLEHDPKHGRLARFLIRRWSKIQAPLGYSSTRKRPTLDPIVQAPAPVPKRHCPEPLIKPVVHVSPRIVKPVQTSSQSPKGNCLPKRKVASLFELATKTINMNMKVKPSNLMTPIPCSVLRRILIRMSSDALAHLYYLMPYLEDGLEEIWRELTIRDFGKVQRLKFESWRDTYRRVEDRKDFEAFASFLDRMEKRWAQFEKKSSRYSGSSSSMVQSQNFKMAKKAETTENAPNQVLKRRSSGGSSSSSSSGYSSDHEFSSNNKPSPAQNQIPGPRRVSPPIAKAKRSSKDSKKVSPLMRQAVRQAAAMCRR